MSFVGLLLMWSALQHPGVTAAARGQQAAGYGHSWGASFGTAFNDEGRGIAVTNDGSVIWTGTTLDFPNASEEQVPMTVVQRRCGGVSPVWSLAFVVEGVGPNSVVSRALTLADPTVEAPSDGLAYVAGRFTGQVDFGVVNAPAAAEQPTAYVAKIREAGDGCASGVGQAAWVADFRGNPGGTNGTSAALAVATARRKRLCTVPQADVSDAVFERIAVGGYFNGTIALGAATSNADDAFVALIDRGGGVLRVFTIGGEGDQRITALAIDERTQDLFVAGWYDNILTNFNPDPNGPPVLSSNYQSEDNERDMFVARIRVPASGAPELISLWTHGSPLVGPISHDEATCIALGVNDDATLSTLAFVGGWTDGAATGRDLYFAAIQDGGSVKWMFNPPGSGDDRVLGVAMDGLGRPVFTGQFGCAYAPGTPCLDPSIQFGSTALSPSGLDAFVARFHPISGGVDWAYQIGGALDDSATAIAFDPASTGRFALTGWFGRPDAAPGQYTIDLDPGPGAAPVTGEGFADAFVSLMAPVASENLGFQISLVLDNSCSMDVPPGGGGPRPYDAMMAMIRSVMTDPVFIAIPRVGDPRPGGGTRQAAVQLNAIFHSVAVPGSVAPPGARSARVAMPWTEIDGDTAGLFARRLAATPEYLPENQAAQAADGFLLARDRLAFSGVGGDASASVLLLGNSIVPDSLRSASNSITGPGFFDRVCAIGVQSVSRDNLLLHAIAPAPPRPVTAIDIDRRSIGVAAYAPTFGAADGPFAGLLQRLSWCPSDYTRDECTSVETSPPNDEDAWLVGYTIPPISLYADWNMDGTFEPDPYHQDAIDRPKLLKGLPISGFVCHSCPPPRP